MKFAPTSRQHRSATSFSNSSSRDDVSAWRAMASTTQAESSCRATARLSGQQGGTQWRKMSFVECRWIARRRRGRATTRARATISAQLHARRSSIQIPGNTSSRGHRKVRLTRADLHRAPRRNCSKGIRVIVAGEMIRTRQIGFALAAFLVSQPGLGLVCQLNCRPSERDLRQSAREVSSTGCHEEAVSGNLAGAAIVGVPAHGCDHFSASATSPVVEKLHRPSTLIAAPVVSVSLSSRAAER